MKPEIKEGNVVFSKKGRDKGRYFVVLYMVDADFVMMTDGDTRKLDHQKKKRRKHLCACPFEAPALLEKLAAGQLKDSDVRSALRPFHAGEAAPVSPADHLPQLKRDEQR